MDFPCSKKEFSKILKVYQDEIVERCEEEKRDKNRTRSRRKINDEYRPQFYAVDKIRHREAIYGKKHKSIKKFGKKIKKITPLFRTIGKLVANSIVNLLNNDGSMVTGSVFVDGVPYNFALNGVML